MGEPLLTIGMPIYMGGRHEGALLRRSLKSLLGQTCQDFRVIMVNNDSPDETEDIIKQVIGSDPRFVYLRNQRNFGFFYSMYRILTSCLTEFFVELHFDSYWAPTYAEKCLGVLKTDSQAVLAYSQCQFVDEDNNFLDLYRDAAGYAQPTPDERYLSVLANMGWCTAYHGIMRHTTAVKHFERTLPARNAANDNEFLALMALEGKLVQIEEPLFFRLKDSYQRNPETIELRQNRLYFNSPYFTKPYFLPFCRWIRDHCRDVANFDLPLENKNSLINKTVSIILSRYRPHIEYEINRAVDLLLEGDFKAGLADSTEAPQGRYRYLDFVFLSELALELEFAALLLPDFGRINLALAAIKINLGHQAEALPLLERQAELTPTDLKTHSLKSRLEASLSSQKKAKEQDQP